MAVAARATTDSDPVTYLQDLDFWTLVKDKRLILDYLEEFAQKVTAGIHQFTHNTKKSILLEVLLAILLPYVVAVGFCVFLIIKLEKEKRQVFTSFKALPKSALSTIVQNLNAQAHKGDDDEEEKVTASAQEENALRVLSTSVEHGFGWLGRAWSIIVLLVLFTIATAAVIIILLVFSYQMGDTYNQVSPLLMEVPRLTTQFEAMGTCLLELTSVGEFPADATDFELPKDIQYGDSDLDAVVTELAQYITEIPDILNDLRIMDTDLNATGMSIGGEDFIKLLTTPTCSRTSFELESIFDALMCTSFESASALLIQRIFQIFWKLFQYVKGVPVDVSDLVFDS